MTTPPLLTIVCICYNQEQFIAQALDSFLIQKTCFPFQILIADDCSTDKTPEIIDYYANLHPNKFHVIHNPNNLGGPTNFRNTLDLVNTPYVIVNEGDDYFIDPQKLQKQVDYLNNHPESSICFHPVQVIWETGTEKTSVFPSNSILSSVNMSFDGLIKNNFIQTNSCMYRWRFIDSNFKDIFPENILPGDLFLHLLHAEVGEIGMLTDVMSVYRKWGGGLWDGHGVSKRWFINCTEGYINFVNAIHTQFNIDFNSKRLPHYASQCILASLERGRFDTLESLQKNHPALYSQAITSLEMAMSTKNIPENKALHYSFYKFLENISPRFLKRYFKEKRKAFFEHP